MIRKGILLVAAITTCAAVAGDLEAQDWRRQQFPQGGRVVRRHPQHPQPPQGRVPRLDPSAMSDRPPSGAHTDPSAQSDVYPNYPPPVYPPSVSDPYPPFYPPVQPNYPPVQPVYQHLGVDYQSTYSGAYITRVHPYTPAFRIGLEPGDVIYSVDGISAAGRSLGQLIRNSDGFVELYIRNVRDGGTVIRNVDLRN